MAVAGSLLIEIGMDVARLQVDVDKARGSILNMEKGVVSLKNAFGQLAAATGVILGLRKAWDLVDQASQLQEQRQALANLAADYNVTSDVIIASMKRAADGTISQSDAIKLATKGMMIGLDPNQLVKFTELSKTIGNALGKNIEEVMETIERATVSGAKAEVTLKKELGVIVDLDMAYQKYAATHHLLVNELTDETKRRITINELMSQSDNIINKLGTDTATMADAMERFKATIADIKITLGEWIATTLAAFAGVMALAAAGGVEIWRQTVSIIDFMLGKVETLYGWLKNIANLGSKLPVIGDAFQFVAQGLAVLEKGMKDNRAGLKEHSLNLDALIEDFDRMADKAFKMASGIGKVKEGIKAGLKPAIEEVIQTVIIMKDQFDLLEERNIRWENARALSLNDYDKALEDMKQAEMDAAAANSAWLTRSIMDYENATNALRKFQEQQTPQQSLDKDIVSGSSPLAALMIGGQERLKVLDNFNKQELNLLADKQAAELEMYTQFGETKAMQDERIANNAIAFKKVEAKQSIAIDTMKYSVGLQILGGAMAATGQYMMSQGKKNFEIGKKISMAAIIINTAQAVMAALASPPGPPWTFILAAAVGAMGAAQLAIAAGQHFQGGGGSVGAVSGGGVFSGPATTGNVLNSDFEFEKDKPLPTQNITINVYNPMDGKVSDELADAIIMAINDAPNRNVTINAQAVN